MQNCNKIGKQMSLVYFALLGCAVFLCISLPLIFFKTLSFLFPKAMDFYYFTLYIGAKVLVGLSPVKFNRFEIESISTFHPENFLIVSNHRSHLDMFILLANVYKIRPVANGKLFKVPVLGQAMKAANYFPLEKGNMQSYTTALSNIVSALKSLHVVLFFPEMTRCRPKSEGIQKFRLTAFQIARENNQKIVPVVLSGTDEIWPKGKLEADFRNRVSIVALPPVDPGLFSTSAEMSLHIHGLMETKLRELNA